MPPEIQARIAHSIGNAIEKRIIPMILVINNEVKAISAAQKTSSSFVEGILQDLRKNIGLDIQNYSQEIALDLLMVGSVLSNQLKYRSDIHELNEGSMLRMLKPLYLSYPRVCLEYYLVTKYKGGS